MESERVAELQRALDELKEKSQADQRRIVKRLKELSDQEKQKIIEDYESRLAKQANELNGHVKLKQSELDKSSERLTIMANMVDKLKQARIDLLEKLEQKESEFASKEESLSDEISSLKSELSRLKISNAEDNRSLEEISAGYVLEISQLQEQLAAAQATLKIVQTSSNSEEGSGGHERMPRNDLDQSEELTRLNEALSCKLSELKSAYEGSLQESAGLTAELQHRSSEVTELQQQLNTAIDRSRQLEGEMARLTDDLASFRESHLNSSSTISALEHEVQRLMAQKEVSGHRSPIGSHTIQPISERITPNKNAETDLSDEQISSYQKRIDELECQLKSLGSAQSARLLQEEQTNADNQSDPLSSRQTQLACENCRIQAKDNAEIQYTSQKQPMLAIDESLLIDLDRISATVNELYQIQRQALNQLQASDGSKLFIAPSGHLSADIDYQSKYADLAQFERHWHTICSHQQDVIHCLMQAQSDKTAGVSTIQALQRSNERLKEIIKEQIEQHKVRISNANERVSLTEASLAAEKKRVQQLASALRKMKESTSAAAESQTLRQDLESALTRAESAETQVAHLQASLEMIELAQKESIHQQKLTATKIEQLRSAVQVEKDRVEALTEENQKISSLLVRANKTIAELKDADHLQSGQVSRLSAMISAHWLLDTSSLAAQNITPKFEVNQRCQIDASWWLFIHVKWKLGDTTASRFFWTTIEAFDNYSGQKIITGLMSDTELCENRNSCVLSSGVTLPESIESRSEAALKAKFDKKWSSASKKFERKITELNEKLRSSQSEIDKISSEFEEYRKQATLALEKTSGGAIKMAEMLDRIDQLEQERDLLQSSLREASQRSVDQNNVEIQRLQGVIESTRTCFHQSEVKWSHELQALQVENERLLNRNQQEESALVESLTERLGIAQEELQRHRSSATVIIKERDQTIADLHKQFVSAQENCQELERQIRILQAELVSLKQNSPRQTHRSVVSAPSETFQQQEQQQQPRLQLSPEHRRSRTDSTDQSVQIQKLQSLLRDAELQREHQAAQMRQLQSQVRELSKSNERSGANLDYLKHIVVKYMETDERLTLLPVIANILAFDPEETERIRAKIEKTSNSGLIPKIW